MTEPSLKELSNWPIGERMARVEQKAHDSDKALDLARDNVSIAQLVSVLTLILSIVALIMAFVRK